MGGALHSVLGVFLVASLATACSGSSSNGGAAPSRVLVGVIDGSDARVALVTSGGKAAIYVCGGDTTYATLTRWFDGNDGTALDLAKDGWTAHADFASGGVAHGTLRDANGKTFSFSAAQAASGTIAGLYAVTDEGCRTGVIVTQPTASDQPAVQGVWCSVLPSAANPFEQVTPVKPVELHDGAIVVQVQALQKTLTARPFVPTGS